ncbi:hypothetical protein RFI_22933 [Reticulomyxa filosa]|uniref:T-complex protein 1 subunit delta n=1 Tax=Reticulomyxa filosa TaxID=46433 RepID=X6MLD7_RETFI|nr:hypothetical protein RFI_22933 [Reticulomyxa filosa]|eukprot:ETO14436.1 hypothetical protein RFI_22933 [Reticulomyxa filosa]
MEAECVVGNQEEIDKIARDEKKYISDIVKKVLKIGCNVLLIQKSILRDAVNILGSHYLAKKGIMVIKDIERVDMPFVAKALGCKPCASLDHFTKDKLGEAKLVEEIGTPGGRIVKITGVKNPGKTVSVLVRGSNQLVLEEAERSLHDALCVVRSLVKERHLIAGGGAPEAELRVALSRYADTLDGSQSDCVRAFADALEVIPYTLAENAGLNPIDIVTSLITAHFKGQKFAGIDVKNIFVPCMYTFVICKQKNKKGEVVEDIFKQNVIQPLLVNTSAINLATEFVRMLLKVDDIITCR